MPMTAIFHSMLEGIIAILAHMHSSYFKLLFLRGTHVIHASLASQDRFAQCCSVCLKRYIMLQAFEPSQTFHFGILYRHHLINDVYRNFTCFQLSGFEGSGTGNKALPEQYIAHFPKYINAHTKFSSYFLNRPPFQSLIRLISGTPLLR